MSEKKHTEAQRAIAKDILNELEQQYKVVKANRADELFYKLREYIKQTYLTNEGEK